MPRMRRELRRLYGVRDSLGPALADLAQRLHREGLHKSGHKAHELVQAFGWELAEQIEQEQVRVGLHGQK